MGNIDLIIIINNLAFEISGTSYNKRNEAIDIAIRKFTIYQRECIEQAEKPEEFADELDIQKIEVFAKIG